MTATGEPVSAPERPPFADASLCLYFLAPRSRRTRLIVLALTPWRLANSTRVDPAEYEAATVLGSILARPVGDGELRPDAAATDALVSCAGRARASFNVLTSAFVWSAWFE